MASCADALKHHNVKSANIMNMANFQSLVNIVNVMKKILNTYEYYDVG